MREFIVEALKHAKETGKISGEYTGWKDNVITMEGTIKDGIANLKISRTWNGRSCSSIPVIDMPLTEKSIHNLADFAAENL